MTIILRQCLDYAVKKKYIPSNPFREVKIDTRRLLRKSSHCARKTYTSALMDANINIRTIAKTVGHADERTTLRNYTFDRNEKDERLKKIENALNY